MSRPGLFDRVDAPRIARLAALLMSAPVAVVMARDDTGEHRGPGGDEPLADAGHALCADTAADGVVRIATDPAATASVCVPLRGAGDRQDETVGAICVLAHPGQAWTDEQIAGLVELADVAAAGLALRDLAAEREHARTELAREHAFLNAVLEHLTDGVAACDSDGELAYFNPALREIHGLPERALPSEEWASTYDLFDADGTRLLRPDEIPLARAFAGQLVENQHMVVHAAGRDPQHFLSSGAPIHGPDGQKLGAVVSMHDVTADHRRRRVRRSHLAVATALADNPGSAEAIASAMLHLRTALEPATAGVVMQGDVPDADIDARIVSSVLRSGRPMQAPLGAPFTGVVCCTPIVVSGATVGVLYFAGPSRVLLDDLTSSITDGVAGLLGRCLERERAEQLDRELRATRHDLERVVRHAQDFVWSVEFLPSGRTSVRVTTAPNGVLGGAGEPADSDWATLLTDRIDPADLPEVVRLRDGLVRGRPGEVTCRVRGEDGVVRHIRTRCTVRSEDGRRFVDGVSSDVTEQARFEVVRQHAAPATT